MIAILKLALTLLLLFLGGYSQTPRTWGPSTLIKAGEHEFTSGSLSSGSFNESFYISYSESMINTTKLRHIAYSVKNIDWNLTEEISFQAKS